MYNISLKKIQKTKNQNKWRRE